VKRSQIIAVVIGVLLAACGGDAAVTTLTSVPTTTSTTAAATTTTAAMTTTTALATSTTTPATTTTGAVTPTSVYQVDPAAFFPAVFGAAGDPNGSGCVVDGEALSAGVWFGFATAVSSGVITFDLACFFTGDAAVTAADADGQEAFDFYIRNQNPRTYAVTIAPGADVFIVDATTIVSTQVASVDWPSAESFLSCPGEYCSVWLYVNGGAVTGIVEQYLP